jgi:hypothetical protein
VAAPDVGWSTTTMTRIVVDLPAPFGPRKPVTWLGRNREGRPVDRDLSAEALRQLAYLDHVLDATCVPPGRTTVSRFAPFAVWWMEGERGARID